MAEARKHRRRGVLIAVVAVLGAALIGGFLWLRAKPQPPTFTAVAGTLELTTPGAVVENLAVTGTIVVAADNVTIRSVSVVFSGVEAAIRIADGVRGTTVLDSQITCEDTGAAGIGPGGYTARGVALTGCTAGFRASDQNPATVTNSTLDGAPTGVSSRSARPSTRPAGTFPTERTTGVRDRVTLTDSDSITVDQPGTVIEGLRVKGSITIAADDVVIRDTLVLGGGARYPIRVARVRNALIEHVEVDNGRGGIGIFFNGGSGTVRAVNVHSALDGIRIQASEVTIEDSYVHDLVREAGGHHDTIQIRSGDDVTIRGNTLLPYVASTGDPMNAAIQIGSLQRGPLERLTVENNYMDGGNYTIHGAADIHSGRFVGNVFGPHARYGVRSGMSDSIVWEDNTQEATGEPAR